MKTQSASVGVMFFPLTACILSGRISANFLPCLKEEANYEFQSRHLNCRDQLHHPEGFVDEVGGKLCPTSLGDSPRVGG